ncbi:hypothetical protein KC963_04940, partial [Candidatus Saccharibacteria bacterium]|nr:hypothetical protein [Candidatus Saccharibacteria bacterium]
MRKTKNTIKINGHTYNAVTGELLRAGNSPVSPATNPQPLVAGTIITPNTVPESQPNASINSTKHSKHIAKQAHHQAKHAKRTPEHSKTLMRGSVKKPAQLAHGHDQDHISARSKIAKPSSVVAVKKSARRIDERRLRHATSIPKSHKVTRFSKSHPVKHTPAAKPPQRKPQPIQHHATSTHPRRAAHHQPMHRPKTTEDLLQEALHHATSHKQPAPKRHMRRSQQVAGLSALIVVSGALLAFVAMQSTPAIKMRIASAKAGFDASLPGNSPS